MKIFIHAAALGLALLVSGAALATDAAAPAASPSPTMKAKPDKAAKTEKAAKTDKATKLDKAATEARRRECTQEEEVRGLRTRIERKRFKDKCMKGEKGEKAEK